MSRGNGRMKACALFFIFAAGAGFANNLSGLIETNPTWEPAWWKLWLSLASAVYFSTMVYSDEREKNI